MSPGSTPVGSMNSRIAQRKKYNCKVTTMASADPTGCSGAGVAPPELSTVGTSRLGLYKASTLITHWVHTAPEKEM